MPELHAAESQQSIQREVDSAGQILITENPKLRRSAQAQARRRHGFKMDYFSTIYRSSPE